MNNFKFSFEDESAIREYDNLGAYKQLQEMMTRGEQLNVKFFVKKNTKVTCAWIESRNVSGFTYELKSTSFNGLLRYMFEGRVSDFDDNPKEVESWEEDIDFNFQMMLTFIEKEKHLQYVPLFRERTENITAILPCLKGKIILRAKRDETSLELLREKNQTI